MPGPDRSRQEDPVCHMLVDSQSAALKLEHRGVVYAFCSRACMDAFTASPSLYVAERPE